MVNVSDRFQETFHSFSSWWHSAPLSPITQISVRSWAELTCPSIGRRSSPVQPRAYQLTLGTSPSSQATARAVFPTWGQTVRAQAGRVKL